MKPLTDKQKQVLEHVESYSSQNGFPPTLREIGKAVGLSNVNAVLGHLTALEKKGYLSRTPDTARSIRVLQSPSAMSRLKRKLHEVARTNDGVTHEIVYGLAWTTWKRQPFLAAEAGRWIGEAIEAEALEHGWTIIDRKIEPDHVVLVVRVWPTHSAAQVIRRFQAAGNAVRRRRKRYLPAGSLSGKGYAATTDMTMLDESISRLLEDKQETTDAQADEGPGAGTKPSAGKKKSG